MQRRFFADAERPIQLRAVDGQQQKICGYAAVFFNADDPGTQYELFRYGNYSIIERLMPSAFDRAVKEDDVRALFNHNADAILGRLRAGTLRLSIDGTGLRYEIEPPETQAARDLIESLKRGDVTGSSFSFDYLAKDVIRQSEADGTEKDIIEIRDVKLFDVSPVTFPAYTSTMAGMRLAANGEIDGLRQELEAMRSHRRKALVKSIRSRIVEIESEEIF